MDVTCIRLRTKRTGEVLGCLLGLLFGGICFDLFVRTELLHHYVDYLDKTRYVLVYAISLILFGVVGQLLSVKGTRQNQNKTTVSAELATGSRGSRRLVLLGWCAGFVVLSALLWCGAPRTENDILQKLQTADTPIVVEDFFALAKRGTPRSIPVLVQFITEDHSDLRWNALHTLSVLSGEWSFDVAYDSDQQKKVEALRRCSDWWKENHQRYENYVQN